MNAAAVFGWSAVGVVLGLLVTAAVLFTRAVCMY